MPVVLTRILAVLSTNFVAVANANAFLGGRSRADHGVSTEDIQEMLLSELTGAKNAVQLRSLEQELGPMYEALPKSKDGKLESTAVRYALHRYFSSKHGWFVSGLEPDSQMYVSAMEGLAPAHIQNMFTDRLHGGGMGLKELAVFAATLVDLIHAEAAGQLHRTYNMLQISTDGQVAEEDSNLATKVWLLQYVLGVDLEKFSREDMAEVEQQIAEIYPAWDDTTLWAEDLQLSVVFARQSRRNPFMEYAATFRDALTHVQELGHHFGSFQDLDCRHVKAQLVEVEDEGTGRVPLSRFYVGGAGEWRFTESSAYLRSLGALDETNPRRPSVMIANYVNSRSNCMQASSFYSVCCVNECEGLLTKIELEIAAPSVAPSRLAEVVAALPSDTIDAPRNLSVALLHRLEEVAQANEGRVPLHGRLFSQWMHHAYPRECPFPHVSGTIRPVSPMEFAETMGDDALDASEQEMQEHVASHEDLQLNEVEAELPWTKTEEHLAGQMHWKGSSAPAGNWVLGHLRWVAVFASVALALPFSRFAKLIKGSVGTTESKMDKHLV